MTADSDFCFRVTAKTFRKIGDTIYSIPGDFCIVEADGSLTLLGRGSANIRPLLEMHCLKCHGADEEKMKGGYSLATREAAVAGGDSGPGVDLKNHADSLLLKAVEYKSDELRMPPKGKLPETDLAVLRKWVAAGLPYPAGQLAAKAGKAPAKHAKGGVVTEEAKRYWAFQPVKRPAAPAVKNAAWVKTPIDAFVLAKLDDKGLSPVRPADRATLARRAYYDLWGLPPTPEQLDAFVKDESPDAWPKLIDALLASPHYGEKWGRHWLDVVRYAETNGYERDGPKPNAWRYRDYVIRSFNADKPFPQFVKEQIAGDELPGYNPDAVIATGFYRLGLWDDEPADPKQALFDGYDDLVTVTGQGFLGITMNCARCHEHKADPFPHADYYRLLAFFRDIRPFSDTRGVSSSTNMTDITPPEKRAVYEKELTERQAKIRDLEKQMRAIEDAAIKLMPAEDQRASEGPDRPQVVAKVPGFLDAQTKADYAGLRRDRKTLELKPRPAGQEFALSVNQCDPRPPAVFRCRDLNPDGTAPIRYEFTPERPGRHAWLTAGGRVLAVNVPIDGGDEQHLFDADTGAPFAPLPTLPFRGAKILGLSADRARVLVGRGTRAETYALPGMTPTGEYPHPPTNYGEPDDAHRLLVVFGEFDGRPGSALFRLGETRPFCVLDLGQESLGGGITADGRYGFWGRRDGSVAVADVVPLDRQLPDIPPPPGIGSPADLDANTPEMRLARLHELRKKRDEEDRQFGVEQVDKDAVHQNLRNAALVLAGFHL